MEWLNEKTILTPKDSCSFHLCWTNNGSDPCGIRLCGTKYCIINY